MSRSDFIVDVTLRETCDADLAQLAAIVSHPSVSINQFRIDIDSLQERFRRLQAQQRDSEHYGWLSICVDGAVVGNATYFISSDCKPLAAEIGFNLLPDYWGRGIMSRAISQLISRLFDRQGVEIVFANYFRGNVRCQRLLQRLGFRPVSVPLLHRVKVAYATSCLRWIRFNSLSRDRWPDCITALAKTTVGTTSAIAQARR
jgi:[ribosomal protein S5]-alanine N-acetyltransferase